MVVWPDPFRQGIVFFIKIYTYTFFCEFCGIDTPKALTKEKKVLPFSP
jgi:hypothetical protein